MNPVAKCPLCQSPPRGIEGHDRLLLASGKSSGSYFFECVTCSTLWSRSYEGAGTFVWIDVTATFQN